MLPNTHLLTENLTEKLVDFYHQHLVNYGHSAQGVGWKNEEAQRVRFEQLLKVVNPGEDYLLNDLGCGLGDLVAHLPAQPGTVASYVGYDVMDEMIEHALALHAPNPRCQFVRLDHAGQMRPADYTVASGIFNIRLDVPDDTWLAYLLETIGEMHEKSRKGFAFNVLTTYSDADKMRPELYYADPLFLFDYCKRHFAKNVALLHDYYQYDFTILVRKS